MSTKESTECFEVRQIRDEIARLESIKNKNLHEIVKLKNLRHELTVARLTYGPTPGILLTGGEHKSIDFVCREMDFTGCTPIIATRLQAGLMVLCGVEGKKNPQFVVAYSPKKRLYVYINDDTGYLNSSLRAYPILKTNPALPMIKPLWKIIKWCEEHGYIPDEDGDMIGHSSSDETFFTVKMSQYCGKVMTDDARYHNWRNEWLEGGDDEY